MKKLFIGVVILLVLIGTGAYVFVEWQAGKERGQPIPPPAVTSFEDCVAAGNPVMESYPRQCRSAEGELFIETINDPIEPIAESWGSIQGTVLLGPTCPVMRDPPDPECADKPYQTRLALTTADGSRVLKEFSSTSNGTFTIDVPPGNYAIRSSAAANILPYCASNEIIHVRINDTTTTVVSCDTGIR